jgi:hypothetical protein
VRSVSLSRYVATFDLPDARTAAVRRAVQGMTGVRS